MSKIKTLKKAQIFHVHGKSQYYQYVNFSKLDPKINKILIKIPASFYMDINKLTLKLNGKAKYSK